MAKAKNPRNKKEHGAYYTPREIATFLVNWAVRTPTDVVLDPGCGEGIFLIEAHRKLLELGADPTSVSHQIHGIELDPEAYQQGLESLERVRNGDVSTIVNANFFEIRIANAICLKPTLPAMSFADTTWGLTSSMVLNSKFPAPLSVEPGSSGTLFPLYIFLMLF